MKERAIQDRMAMRNIIFRTLCEAFKDMEISLREIRNISIDLAEDVINFQETNEIINDLNNKIDQRKDNNG